MIGFSIRSYEFPACLCVTGLTGTPTCVFGMLKSVFKKKTGKNSDMNINVQKIEYNENCLETKWGCIEDTIPRNSSSCHNIKHVS